MAHPDLDNLMNALLPFAQQMLAKHGEFYPYGSTMTTGGEIVSQAAYSGDDHPKSQPLIELMTQAFRAMAASGEIRAAGICYDVRTIPPGQTEKTDAICLGLEHQTGQSVSVFLPYKKGWFGKIQYGELFATKRDAEIFVQT
ncbi:MAG: hypothetical protein U0572_11290 [Phycisphaerales bacterium]